MDKTRPTSLATVSQKCELADDQHSAADISQRQIHFSRLVFEDAQRSDLLREKDRIPLRIAVRDTEQYQETPVDLPDDLAADRHLSPRNALYN